jgi:hypothetical protein
MKWENGNALRLGNINSISNEEISFQFKVWKIQQLAWFGFLSLIVAALLGFFGGEYTIQKSVSKTEAGIEYPYLAQGLKPTQWTLRTQKANEVWISNKLAGAVKIDSIWPAPTTSATTGEKLVLHYDKAPGEIVFRVTPHARGFVEGKVGTEKEAFSVGFLSY